MSAENGGDWLWRGTGAMEERRRKAAAVMAAVASVLQSDNPIGVSGQRAVSAFRRLDAFGAGARSWLTGEPYAYLWGRLAYELLGAILHPTSPLAGAAAYYCRINHLDASQALTRHLEDIDRFLVAAALLEGGDTELVSPLVGDAPLALPGTALSLDSRDVIRGVRGGSLRTDSSGATTCPSLRYGGGEWRLQPAVFNVPVVGIPEVVWRTGREFQVEHVNRVEGALHILDGLDDGMLDQIREGLRIIALRPEGAPGELTNLSHCDLPGAISVAPCPHPYELANVIWHEFLHNRLFALEEEGLFLGPAPPGEEDSIYSPWRTDYRPMHGLLHAVYVFTGVGRYWFSVMAAADTPDTVTGLAGTRILCGLYQVRLGLALLRRHARLTERGTRLLDSLEHEHEALWRSAAETGLMRDLPHMTFRCGTPFGVETHDHSVRSRVRNHLDRYARPEHARDLEPLLAV